jgi:hypothetical protein
VFSFEEAAMKNRATFFLSIGALLLVLPLFAGSPANAGVTRTEVNGEDNWGWKDNPLSLGTITCPGGELAYDSNQMPYCADSSTGRLHFRDAVFWSCMTSDDPRTTGVAMFTIQAEFDAEYSGPVWGTWKIVPTAGCDKDGFYPEELVNTATSFWRGIWNGKRLFYSEGGMGIWIGEFMIVGKGFGGDLEGLHFKGSELIQTYTPFPVPYEFLPPVLGLFDDPEGIFTGTITE